MDTREMRHFAFLDGGSIERTPVKCDENRGATWKRLQGTVEEAQEETAREKWRRIYVKGIETEERLQDKGKLRHEVESRRCRFEEETCESN